MCSDMTFDLEKKPVKNSAEKPEAGCWVKTYTEICEVKDLQRKERHKLPGLTSHLLQGSSAYGMFSFLLVRIKYPFTPHSLTTLEPQTKHG